MNTHTSGPPGPSLGPDHDAPKEANIRGFGDGALDRKTESRLIFWVGMMDFDG